MIITQKSIMAAIEDIIAALVEGLTGGLAGGGTSGGLESPGNGGVKEWVQDKLKLLGKMLAWLAEKAAGALPGIIGTLVSWLFKTASAAVGWLAQNW